MGWTIEGGDIIPIPRLNIPALHLEDGPQGVGHGQYLVIMCSIDV